MNKPLRFLAALLALLMLCAPALAEEKKSPLYIEGSEGVTLTYWIPMSSTQTQYFSNLSEHPFWQWMEAQTGVHVEFIHPSEDQMATQATLMMASGNYYDLMFQFEHPDGPQAGIDDGIFVNLNDYADLMPNYQAAIRSENGEYYADWEWGAEKDLYAVTYKPAYLKNALSSDGSLWCVSMIDFEADAFVNRGCLIRKDWLEEAGLDVPETVDELEAVLAAFKQRGENVIPMNLTDTAMQAGCGVLCNMFDIYPAWYTKNAEGKVMVAGFADDHAKDYFALMNKWYEAGYIDPDFMNRGDVTTGWDSLLLSDRLGILVDANATPESYEARYVGDQVFDLVAMPMTRLNEEQILHYNNVSVDTRVNSYTVLSQSCKNKEIAAQWLDRLYGKEAFMRANYGVEGESYAYDENGKPYFTDWYFHNDAYDVPTLRNIYLIYGGTQWGPNYSGLVSHRAMAYLGTAGMDTEAQKARVPASLETMITWSKHSDNAMSLGWVSFEGDEWGKMFDPYTEAATYANAMALKFITGVESLDQFAEYQQKALALGFAESLERMQETYDKNHAND